MPKSPTSPNRVFPQEFQRDAVRLAIERGNLSAAARDLGIHESVLGRWKRALEKESRSPSPFAQKDERPMSAFPGKGNPRDEEMARLERENRRLKEEVEILKKAVGIFTKAPR
jgi:transposase